MHVLVCVCGVYEYIKYVILGGGQGLARVDSLLPLCGFWKSNKSSALAAIAFTH